MMTIIKNVLVVLTTSATIAYLLDLIKHEQGHFDARRWRALLVGSAPGNNSRSRIRRYIVLICLIAAFQLLLIPKLTFTTMLGWPLLMVAVCLIARKDDLKARLEPFFERKGTAKSCAICLVVVTLLEWTALEIPGNLYFVYAMAQKPLSLIAELVIIALINLIVWLIFQRRRWALLIPAVVLFILGVADYYVMLFKQVPILPSDLMSLGTAAAVSANYTYRVGDKVLVALACVYGVAWITSCARCWGNSGKRSKIAINLVGAVALSAAMVLGLTQIDFVNDLGIIVRAWCPVLDYESNGFIPAFTAGVQTIPVREPDGYSTSKADSLIESYAAEYDAGEGASEGRKLAEAQWSEKQPNVIVVMDETFSDFSIFDNLHDDYTGPEFFNSVDDYLMRGTMYVSAFGGGTCNTEFEFLTGCSMNYLGMSVYPYSVYNLAGVSALPQQFADLGYGTSAMHPNLASNWNRDIVYPEFGFQQFLDIESFRDAETIRGYATDTATYKEALSIVENNDSPQFIFDVTMQNHGGYATGEIPEQMQVNYDPSGVANTQNAELNEYLSLINQSDIQLEEFLETLRNLDEPTIVIFWGDHQPYFGGQYNDAYYTDESEIDHTQRLWQTKYLVWANYDVAGADRIDSEQDLSVNYLASTVLEAVGAPLTDAQKAQQAMRSYIPCINMIGYMDADGAWHYASDTNAKNHSEYVDLEYMQYRWLFDYDHGSAGFYLASTGPGQTDPNKSVEEDEAEGAAGEQGEKENAADKKE